MKLQLITSLVLILTSQVGAEEKAGAQKKAKPNQADAVAAIKKLAGKVITLNENRPDQAVVSVNLTGTKATRTKIDDRALIHLRGLTKLEDLFLCGTKVTDAGLVHLQGLTNLEVVYLNSTNVTDAGLVKLNELSKLEFLDLRRTRVTDAGVKKLQQALPKCKILGPKD